MSWYGDIPGGTSFSTASIPCPEDQRWALASESGLWSAPSHLDATNETTTCKTRSSYQPESVGTFQYATNLPLENSQCTGMYSSQNVCGGDSAYPSDFDNSEFLDSFNTIGAAYPPSAYQLAPTAQEVTADAACAASGPVSFAEIGLDCHTPQLSCDHVSVVSTPLHRPTSPLELSSSPDPTRVIQSELLDCHGEGDVDKELPYAQLIYRALMDAPGHTMILRDIYSWFRLNTDKAQDEDTKGWQNSIRHNLSMNGVRIYKLKFSTS
jgi:hypothetical protein